MRVGFFVEEYPDPLYPLSLTTPVFELRYGFRSIMRELKGVFGDPECLIVPQRFSDYVRERYEGVGTRLEDVSSPVVLINSSIRPTSALQLTKLIESLKHGDRVVDNGRLVAIKLDPARAGGGVSTERLISSQGGWVGREVDCLIKGPWELIYALREGLRGSGVVYGSNVRIEEPVSINSEHGPVLIADDVRIEAFTRIEGPAFIGRGSILHSARINPFTYIGEVCRVGGEVESSIISSYSNKAHEGYVGHSYIGSWVNVGAGSVTSDLKNTYGTVRVSRWGARVDTGLIKLGAFVGDHAKIAINTSIYSGRSIGPSSHVYGLVHDDVPPFVVYSTLDSPEATELSLEKALEVARRMMSRRGVELTKGAEKIIRGAYLLTLNERSAFLNKRRRASP